MRAVLASSGVILALVVSSPARAADRVTCVGDSITAGSGLPNPTAQSYPAALASLLGAGYSVGNYGHSGATLLHDGDVPYTAVGPYASSSAFAAGGADVVVQLGTNDSKASNWAKKASFQGDCEALVDHYRAAGAARVWINLVPPVFANACCSINGTVVRDEIVPLLRQCAANKGASTIDVHSALLPHPEYFGDGVHPNLTGAALIAATVRDTLVKRPSVTASVASTTITATPVAAYGKIEHVELFEGTTSIARNTAAPWTLGAASLAAGSHTLHVVATETGGRTASSNMLTIDIAPPPLAPDGSGTAGASVGGAQRSPVVGAGHDGAANPAAGGKEASSADGCSVAGGERPSTTLATALVLAMLLRRRRRYGSSASR